MENKVDLKPQDKPYWSISGFFYTCPLCEAWYCIDQCEPEELKYCPNCGNRVYQELYEE